MDTDTQPSKEVTQSLQQAEQASNKAAAYNDLIRKIITSYQSHELVANFTACGQSIVSCGIVTARPIFTFFVEQLRTTSDPDVKIEIGKQLLELIQPQVVAFEEQDTSVKLILADAYEETEDFTSSAKVLQQISLDSSQRTVSDDDKARVWIRIVRCYLEEDDATSAMGYLNRLKGVMTNISDKPTKVMFQLSQARILDAQRSFLDASRAYHDLSFDSDVDEEERVRALSQAMICAVLAPAGPQRARTLARLYKDDRANQVEEFSILEKIFLDRLLSPEEVKAFAAKLMPHHLAKTADGSTVLDKAVLEHNLLATSRLYKNIGFDQLGELLNVEGERAERYAAQMIEQGRVAGYIDQIDRFIFFEGEGSGQRKTGQTERVVGKELRQWDENVRGLAEEVERVTTMIQNQHPVCVISLNTKKRSKN